MDTTVKGQQEDAQFRLDWLEQRAVQLETSLGMSAPEPGETATQDKQPTNSVDPANETQALNEAGGQNKIVSPPQNGDASTGEQPEKSVKAEDLLKLAKEHLVAGREEAAEAVLNRILKEFPRTEIEPEVRYRLAEAAFNNKRYPESARRFQDVLNRHPASPFASWSLLRQGECFEAMGQTDNAAIFYNDVISEYPKSKAAKEAKAKLKPE